MEVAGEIFQAAVHGHSRNCFSEFQLPSQLQRGNTI